MTAESLVINADKISIKSGAIENNNASDSSNSTGASIFINANSLEIQGGAIESNTTNNGNAGDININVNSLSMKNGTIRSDAFEGNGNGGTVNIAADTVEIESGSITSITFSDGNAGGINIKANTVSFSNEGALDTSSRGAGNAGNINIQTGELLVQDGSFVVIQTFTLGKGGNLNINASDRIQIIGTSADDFSTGLFTSSASEATGDGGDLSIKTGQLMVHNAQISAQTTGAGMAGNLQINAPEVEVSGLGSGLFSRTGGTGDAGTLTMNASKLRIIDNAQVGVNNFIETGFRTETSIDSLGNPVTRVVPIFDERTGSGSAGILNIEATSLELEDGGRIVAESAGADGGNIQLKVDDFILLRRNSSISSTAGLQETGGSGGNIEINTGVLAGFENSDITANSIQGRGGNVVINAEGVFGMQLRDEDSPLETPTNDITATGANNELSGNVEINTPESDPTRGLAEVPPNTVDPSNQIYDPCTPGNPGFGNSFVSIGRGGLPMNPTEPLQETGTISTWVKLKPQSPSGTNRNTTDRKTTNRKTSSQPTTTKTPKVEKQTEAERPTQIVEATGWIVNENGNIEFVAQANRTNPTSPWQNPASCSVSGEKEEGRRKKEEGRSRKEEKLATDEKR